MHSWHQIFYLLRTLAIKLATPRRLALLALCAYALAVLFDPRPDSISSEQSIQENLNIEHQIISGDDSTDNQPSLELSWQALSVASGDNLSTLFFRAGLSSADVYQISASREGTSLRNLYPGEKLHFGIDKHGQLIEMRYEKSALEFFIFTASNNGYSSRKLIREPEVLTSYREGVIKGSLYLAGKKAKLPDKTVMELANIFGWDIDFVFDIRKGDSFSLLFEERYIDGKKLGAGNILAATFTNQGKTFKAVRFTDSANQSSYYTPEGLSMRKAFLRTPLDIFSD